eukprot:scaffold12840_cov79-Isochrysis_galbana.AAC.1
MVGCPSQKRTGPQTRNGRGPKLTIDGDQAKNGWVPEPKKNRAPNEKWAGGLPRGRYTPGRVSA